VIFGPADSPPAAMKNRLANSSDTTERSFLITGLKSKTSYDWYAACANATMVRGPTVTTQ